MLATEVTHYVKALGSVCYNAAGVNHPFNLRINIQQLVGIKGGQLVSWHRQFGWSNQPMVVIFSAQDMTGGTGGTIQELNNVLSEIGLLAVEIGEEWQRAYIED